MEDTTATQVNNLRNQIAEQKAELKRLEQIQKAIQKRKSEITKYGEKMDIMGEKDKIAYIIWVFRHFELNEKMDVYYSLPTTREICKAFVHFFYKSSTAKQFKITISPHSRYTAKYNFTFLEYKELFQNLYPNWEFQYEDLLNGIWDEFPLLMTNEEECNICNDKKYKADMVCFVNEAFCVCACKYDVCLDCACKINPAKCILCRTPFTKLRYKN